MTANYGRVKTFTIKVHGLQINQLVTFSCRTKHFSIKFESQAAPQCAYDSLQHK